MNDERVLSARIPQPTRDELAAEYRERRMSGDVDGAKAVAFRAFRLDMFRPRNLVTGKPRSFPLSEREYARLEAIREARWDCYLARPGAVRPPRFHDGERLAGF